MPDYKKIEMEEERQDVALESETDAAAGDGLKTGDVDARSEAQRIADAMVAKKLRNMPKKEELMEFRRWKQEMAGCMARLRTRRHCGRWSWKKGLRRRWLPLTRGLRRIIWTMR
ncbi:MAG: hypothetical protein ACOYJB_07670 [Christensenellaceae bacterium]